MEVEGGVGGCCSSPGEVIFEVAVLSGFGLGRGFGARGEEEGPELIVGGRRLVCAASLEGECALL